jgi:tetratricopeptide (TPR) repeat protein
VVGTKNGLNLGGKIDPRTVPDVLEQATELHQAGKLLEAERGYREILNIEPKNADAIHRLGQLFTNKGDHISAKRLFKSLTAIRPDAYKSWLCLAQSCEALGQNLDAANAYREIIRLKPDMPETFKSLAEALVKLGRIAEVNAALVAALGRPAAVSGKNGGELKRKRVADRAVTQGEAASL